MYGTLALTPRSVRDYAPFAGKDRIDELSALAAPLRGLRVLNLSVTAFGTGLAELLRASVPLFCDLGLDWRWQIVRADEEATQVNKLMYRALAGGRVEWTPEMDRGVAPLHGDERGASSTKTSTSSSSTTSSRSAIRILCRVVRRRGHAGCCTATSTCRRRSPTSGSCWRSICNSTTAG